jgi:hypothetical protein
MSIFSAKCLDKVVIFRRYHKEMLTEEKTICLEIKRKASNVIIKHKRRYFSKDGRLFDAVTIVKDYLFDYRRRTTIK